MGLLDKLPDSVFGLKGATPKAVPGASSNSTTHAPIEGISSKFDLDGTTPAKYSDNLPG